MVKRLDHRLNITSRANILTYFLFAILPVVVAVPVQHSFHPPSLWSAQLHYNKEENMFFNIWNQKGRNKTFYLKTVAST